MTPNLLNELVRLERIANAADLYEAARYISDLIAPSISGLVELTPAEKHHLSIGESKIDVIRSVRARTGLSLADSKRVVDAYEKTLHTL